MKGQDFHLPISQTQRASPRPQGIKHRLLVAGLLMGLLAHQHLLAVPKHLAPVTL